MLSDADGRESGVLTVDHAVAAVLAGGTALVDLPGQVFDDRVGDGATLDGCNRVNVKVS
jgi:hypothetical protein